MVLSVLLTLIVGMLWASPLKDIDEPWNAEEFKSLHPDEYFGLSYHLKNAKGLSHPAREIVKKMIKREGLWPLPPDIEPIERKYLLQTLSMGIRDEIELKGKRSPASSETSGKFPLHHGLHFSLVVFKRGDLRERCEGLVQDSLKAKSSHVTIFWPVPYSKEKKDSFRFFPQGAPSLDEFFECTRKIYSYGLVLNFVPHLENIKTLMPGEKPEWRIDSGIILNDEYFKAAYDPIFSFIKLERKLMKSKNIRISLAAEIDPSFFYSLSSIEKFIHDSENKLVQQKVEWSWNPNGDFQHGWQYFEGKPNCEPLPRVMGKISRIAPSLYEKNRHFVLTQGKIDWNLTKFKFRENLKDKARELCTHTMDLSRVDTWLFSAGEMALIEPDRKRYLELLEQLHPHEDVTMWNEGEWDHRRQLASDPDP